MARWIFFAISLISVGMAIGYSLDASGGLPVTEGIVIVIALTVALLTAYRSGRVSASPEPVDGRSEESWAAFRQELDRSRRFERSFTLMRLPKVAATLRTAGTEQGGSLGILPLMLRSVDQVWAMDGSVYLLLPESTLTSARELVARLRATMADTLPLNEVELAEFPADGLTTGALIANLRPFPEPGEPIPVRLVTTGVEQRSGSTERTG